MTTLETTNSRLPAPPRATPLRSIRASKGIAALNLGEILQFKDLLFTLALKDIKVRYKQTALGVAWVVIQPLIAAGIFSIVFGKIADIPTNPVPYMIFSFASVLAWNFFSGIVARMSICLTNNASLIAKVSFPRMILPISTVPTFMLDFSICFLLLLAFLIPNHASISWGLPLLLLPVWMALITLLAVGMGLCFAALNVTYRDVQYIVPVAMQMLMYASPVPYPASFALSKLDSNWQLVFYANPLTSLLEGFRWSLLGTTSAPNAWASLYSAALCVCVFLAGATVFKRMERKFADII